jgi:hypothetical protein
LQGLVNHEVDRRREIISARVLEALEAIDGRHRDPVLAEMLQFSGPIERARKPFVTAYIATTRNEREYVVLIDNRVVAGPFKTAAEAGQGAG